MRFLASSKYKVFVLTLCWILIGLLPDSEASAGTAGTTSPSEPTDYTLLSHDLDVTVIRAGAHNGEKPNNYVFKVTAYGLSNVPEEKAKDLKERKKVTAELGTFGETKLDPLAYWRQDSKVKDLKQLRVDGKAVRDLVAKTMSELQISENQVAIQTDISLIAKRKKYYVLNDDQVIATVSFTPLVKTGAGVTSSDQSFTMTDDKGAVAKLNVHFSSTAGTAEKAAK
ncbi:MAG: hypothetical protein FJ146_02195 [Deltaproteobacteria bacterium]|nr:hypothetical protein [Deltaproteobacteria bacterium]